MRRVQSAREGVMASKQPRRPGWYSDWSDPEAERYWDGTEWGPVRPYIGGEDIPAGEPGGRWTTAQVVVMAGFLLLVVVTMYLVARAVIGP
jgi:hypothetical protein